MTTTIEAMRDDYDWQEAFAYSPVPMDDVAETIVSVDGENDGPEWLGVFRLRDGRFLFLTAGCDYTGWDCQAGGSGEVRDDLDTLIWNDIGENDRERLGYPKDREAAQ
jgi:hypothetical protein